jgi:hypothetical protein
MLLFAVVRSCPQNIEISTFNASTRWNCWITANWKNLKKGRKKGAPLYSHAILKVRR